MTKLFTTSIFLLFLLFSCSSDDSNEITPETPSVENPNDPIVTIIDESDNSITLDGEEYIFSQITALRQEDGFAIRLDNLENETIWLTFHKNGNYNSIIYSKNNENEDFSELFQTLDINPSRDFSFEILNIDEINNRVSINFDGILYDEGSLFSDEERELTDKIQISSTLNLSYKIEEPMFVEGIDVSVFIDGEEWHSLKSYTEGIAGVSNITLSHENDTEFVISLVLDADNIIPGTYNFDTSSQGANRLFLYEYIVKDGKDTTIQYLSEGVLTIESIETIGFQVFRAQFSFTARHPETNEEIEVTSGIFNTVFSF